MSAEVETMVSGENIVPWHRLGKVIPGLMTADEVLCNAGLDWTVSKEPIYSFVDNVKIHIPDHFSVIRSKDKRAIGVVGSVYEPIQNVDALDWMDAIVGNGQAVYETAGSLKLGSVVWIAAKIPNGGQPDKPIKYLVARTSHDGSTTADVYFTPIRPVCWNTLRASINGRKSYMAIRHTTGAKEKMEQAKKVIQSAIEYFSSLEEVFSKMHEKRFTPEQLTNTVKALFPVPKKEDGEESKRSLTRQEKIVAEILKLSVNGKGVDLPGVKGTAWGGYNAIVEYLDHFSKINKEDEGNVAERRFESNVWGRSALLKQSAFDLIVNDVKLAA